MWHGGAIKAGVCSHRMTSQAEAAPRRGLGREGLGPPSVLLMFLCLSLAIGCTSTSSSIDPHGNFTNANLKGNYAYLLSGSRFGQSSGNGLFQEAGTFVADGNGHITGGSDDYMQGTLVTQPVSGSYSIAADGTGTINLSIAGRQLDLI